MGVGAMPIRITDRDGRPLYDGRIYGLPIREGVVIQKSIDFFNDPDPCYKHRGAVHVRLWTEFEQFLAQSGEESVVVDRLPDTLRGYVDFGETREDHP